MDISRLPGLRTVIQSAQHFWTDARAAVTENSELSVTLFLTIMIYSLVFWSVGALLIWLTRFVMRDEVHHRFRRLVQFVLFLTCLLLILESIATLFEEVRVLAPIVFRSYLLVLTIYLLAILGEFILRRNVERESIDASLGLLISNGLRLLWGLLALYLVFRQFNVNVLPLLGGLGVVGVAFGFAAQDLLGSLVSGMALLLDRPFRIGDWIRVNDHEGQVTGLSMRTTRIRTRDNSTVNVPNREIAGGTVLNLTQNGPLRLSVLISIAYSADVEQARQVLLEVMNAHPALLHEEDRQPAVLVNALAPSTVDLLMVFWIEEEEVPAYPLIEMQLRERAKAALDGAGIEIPFPNLQLHIESARGLEESLGRVLGPGVMAQERMVVAAHEETTTPAPRQATPHANETE